MKNQVIIFCLLLLSSAIYAQSVTLTQPFTQTPNATVLDTYGEQFRKWEKPDLDDTFPYALIRVGLEGNEHEVLMAKQMLGMYMGTQTAVEAINRSAENELLFLIPKRARYVEITCGDGCARLTIMDGTTPLQSNRIYYGKIHYLPLEDVSSLTHTRQKFQLLVSPKNAVAEVFIDGKPEFWPLTNGVASKMLNQGTYRYRVTAERYYSQEGTFVVSPHSSELQLTLRPQFGWAKIDGDTHLYGAHVFATNVATESTIPLGTIPIEQAELATGRYMLTILLDKYKDYSTTLTIQEAKTTEVYPIMEPNYSTVTLNAAEMADIYVDGRKVGKGTWTGTLEYGEYLIETQQQSHHSAYTSISIAQGDVNVVYTLNNPIPLYGTLIIDGQPLDANIAIDNVQKGTTPMVFNQILVGEHRVRITKFGYVETEQIITIKEGEDTNIAYSLPKADHLQAMNVSRPIGMSAEDIHVFSLQDLNFAMIKVKGGTFIMGATEEHREEMDNNEIPIHQVTVSDFYMAQTEVTQALWKAVMGNNPSAFPSNPANPVENVSWSDCQTFIQKLNAMTGQNFRLPTEAEWEFAARGGRDTINYKYAGDNIPTNVAWIAENSDATTHIVAMKQPNQLGLYDMSGNVCEWCQDWYANYEVSNQKNPQGPANGAYKVYRGGSWYFDASYARVAKRNHHTTTFSNYNIGLRLALTQVGEQNVPSKVEEEKKIVAPTMTSDAYSINVADVVLTMVNVKGGEFTMGATEEQGTDAMGGELPVRQITLTDYAISQTEVTQALWQAVMGNNPSKDTTLLLYPVTNVTWQDCQVFIHKLNELTGRHFRLPTEAEWEFAARGGKAGKRTKYAGSNAITDVAWYNANSSGKICPVAQKLPNELGVYDMSGNVCEWCNDWFGTYAGNNIANPKGPANGSYRVVRGGSAQTPMNMQRVSYRNGYAPTDKHADVGLRLVEEKQSNPEKNTKTFQIPMHESKWRIEVNGVVFTMIKVESGSFIMGATEEHQEIAYDWEKPMHYVTLPNFFMAQTEVTQALWQAVMDSLPSNFKNDPNNPVENVSWEDCQIFIRKLNELTGASFRLPTEAEWEFAARGGKLSKKMLYAGSANIDEVAWNRENSLGTTHPVGLKKANELGIYDMGGNVWEWCADWYGKYESTSQINPKGPESSTTNRRVIRGGSWAYDANNCRVTVRSGQAATDRKIDIGFRLAL